MVNGHILRAPNVRVMDGLLKEGDVNDAEFMARQFEQYRGHLRAVAYRLLGSLSEADDAVQETWLRLSRSAPSDLTNIGGWLTTVVGRVSIDMLRSRAARREESLETYIPDLISLADDSIPPEETASMSDAVGIALMVVLQSMDPAERLAFILHDVFDVPFDNIASILGRSNAAARKLASRARHRARSATAFNPDIKHQRRAARAFLRAVDHGDWDSLMRVLDPSATIPVARGGVGACR